VYRRPVLVNVVVVWWRMEMMMTVFLYLFSSLVSGYGLCEVLVVTTWEFFGGGVGGKRYSINIVM
jgi:hypothetical protein